MRRLILFGFIAVTTFSCGPRDEHRSEWLEVLEKKRAIDSSTSPVAARQAYADAVVEFLGRHPEHPRARRVWLELQLERATELAAAGRYSDAIPYFETVLARDPGNEDAEAGLAAVRDRAIVTGEELTRLAEGMSQEEVLAQLGAPRPEWKKRAMKGETASASWYYQAPEEQIAAVFFVDGKLLTAELNGERIRLAGRSDR